MNDNLKALLDREPKEDLEYFRGAMQKLLAPYPGSYDLLGKVVAAFYVYEETEELPPIDEAETLYLFVTGREARNYEEDERWQSTQGLLNLLVGADVETAEAWNSFCVEMEDAWNNY